MRFSSRKPGCTITPDDIHFSRLLPELSDLQRQVLTFEQLRIERQALLAEIDTLRTLLQQHKISDYAVPDWLHQSDEQLDTLLNEGQGMISSLSREHAIAPYSWRRKLRNHLS